MKKTRHFFNERISTAKATNSAPAIRIPVYLAPAAAPARTPARTQDAASGERTARSTARTPRGSSVHIQTSGAPAEVICQTATGVRLNASAAAKGQAPPIH